MAGIKEISIIRQEIIDLGCELVNDIDHGECFYEKDMLNDFIANLDKMKKLATKYHDLNQERTRRIKSDKN